MIAVGTALEGVMRRSVAARLRPPGASKPCTLQARIVLALAQWEPAELELSGLTMTRLAEQLGVSRQTLARAWAALVARGVIAMSTQQVPRIVPRLVWTNVVRMQAVTTITVNLDAVDRAPKGSNP